MNPRQNPGELHPDIMAGWKFAEEVRAGLLQSIRPSTAAQWTFRPGPATWSIAEIVDHLLRAEIGSSKMVRKLIRGDFMAHAMPGGARLYGRDLHRYPYARLKAPHVLVPGRIRERRDLETDLTLAHARFRTELSAFRGENPEALRSADPATGDWFTLGGWVKLQAWHEAHHLSQIRRIMAVPGFPAE